MDEILQIKMDKIIKLLEESIEVSKRIEKIFSKYDKEYLSSVEKEELRQG